jgi:hypothetical protein
MPHGIDGDGCPVTGNRRRQDDIDGAVVQETTPLHGREQGKAILEPLKNPWVARVRIVAGAGCAGVEEPSHHVVDMAVVETDNGEAHPISLCCLSPGPSA